MKKLNNYINCKIFYSDLLSAVQCPTPDNVANALFTEASKGIGATVTYVCDLGYIQNSGNMVRTCDNDGTWDGTLPSCTGNS